MIPYHIAECLALFDRVNPEPDMRDRSLFECALTDGPGIALGAVIDYCLPERMVYTVSTCEPGPYAWVGRPGADTVAHMEENAALAMVRAIAAAMDWEAATIQDQKA